MADQFVRATVQVDDLDISPSKIGESAQRIIDRAIEEARRREHAVLTNEHVFLAFAQVEWDVFAEVMRGLATSGTTLFHTTNVQSGDIAVAPAMYDGRAVSGCAGGTPGVRIQYVGLQYYRGGINHNSFYTHTLPVNWNRKQTVTANQKYTCGDSSFRRAHIAASSYHSGGVNVGMADGSCRFVRDTIDFTLWQNAGTRAGGEDAGLN